MLDPIVNLDAWRCLMRIYSCCEASLKEDAFKVQNQEIQEQAHFTQMGRMREVLAVPILFLFLVCPKS